MSHRRSSLSFRISLLSLVATANVVNSACCQEFIELPADVMEDKIRGGLVGQLLGNLNGLPHEFDYIKEPGDVRGYVPSLPDGARTDDDTDVEWVYIVEMQRTRQLYVPPSRAVELWKAHINDWVWAANDYARQLMEVGLEPPLTGNPVLNPWANTNVAGLFMIEMFSLAAPAMPRTAAELSTYYAHSVVDGEPIQATQLLSTIIALAFIERDIETLIDAGQKAVDPNSEVHGIVNFVREQHRANPDDWRKTRMAIRDKYTRYGGVRPDINGYALNTAAVLAALYYGKGNFLPTMELAFSMGWDADNSAAMCGTILGVIYGNKWLNAQGWDIKDVYQNRGNRRPGMPTKETITSFGNRIIAVAEIALNEQKARMVDNSGHRIYLIPKQSPTNVERLADSVVRKAKLKQDLLAKIEQDLTRGDDTDRARAVYLAICLNEHEDLMQRHPKDWRWGVQRLYRVAPSLVVALFTSDKPFGGPLRERAHAAGVLQPKE